MDQFTVCALTSSGTAELYEGEYPVTTIHDVSLQTSDRKATPHSNGLITVSTHRVIWIDSRRSRAICCPLWLLQGRGYEDKSSRFRGRVVSLNVGSGVRVCFDSKTSVKDRDAFANAVSSGVTKKEWERIAREKRAEAEKELRKMETEYVPVGLGMRAVQQHVLKHAAEQEANISSGFGSIDQLRDQAKDMMEIAKQFRERGKQMKGEEANELIAMMAELGIETPVTKESTGGNLRVYRDELSREISRFLLKPLLQVGGIMTLTDAYLLVMRNRATTELVSPADFRSAVDSFKRLNVAIEVVRLESGELSLQLDSSKDVSGLKSLQELAETRGGISAIDVMRIRHIPIQVAQRMVETAEEAGYLARDEGGEGVLFFKNRFDEFLVT